VYVYTFSVFLLGKAKIQKKPEIKEKIRLFIYQCVSSFHGLVFIRLRFNLSRKGWRMGHFVLIIKRNIDENLIFIPSNF